MADKDTERGRRLRRIRRSLDETQAEFGARFGKTGPAVSYYEIGEMPHMAVLRGLHEMGYSLEWLLMGEGHMRRHGQMDTEGGEIVSTLKESEEDGIGIVQDGILTFANRAMGRLTRHRVEELVGHSFLSLIVPRDGAPTIRQYEECLRGNMPPDDRMFAIRCKDGTVKDVTLSFGSVRYGGRPAVLAVVRDTADRRAARSDWYGRGFGEFTAPLTGEERKLVKILKGLLEEVVKEKPGG